MNSQIVKKETLFDLKDQLPELIDDNFKVTINRLPSKKNLVYELIFEKKPQKYPKEIIVKHFRSEHAMKEYETLLKLKELDLSIPKPLYFKNPYLILERISGINLCDFINEKLVNTTKLDDLHAEQRDMVVNSVKLLAGWLARLHDKTVIKTENSSEFVALNKGDTKLRDFILNSSLTELYGFDFEDSYEGNHLDDLAWLSCSFLDTNPGIFEIHEPVHKIELINIFLEEYYFNNNHFKFDFNYFAELLIENLNMVIERRALHKISFNKEAILRKIVNKL